MTPNITYTPEVILAPADIKWLIDQPDEALSIYDVLMEDVNFHYTSPRSWQFSRPFHVEALNKMHLDLMTPAIVDEIDICISKFFGTDTSTWTKVSLRDALWPTISRITNRVFVGLPLAHDTSYIDAASSFIISILQQSTIITLFTPLLLRPILGHLLALPCRYYDYRCSTYLVPIIKQHLAAEIAGPSDTDSPRDNPDMIQLKARFAAKSSDPRDHDPRSLCSRLLALNFVGIHTSSSAAINAFIDIASAGPAVYQGLRDEATAALHDAGGTWNKVAVAKLVHLDSCLRESLRFSAFKARGVERRVIAPLGVTLPDGTLLSRGTKIGLPTAEIHTDADFYPNPHEFISDRFMGRAELGLVHTTDTFLAFGHGRHACPGRFFSTHELKLVFASLVLKYDLTCFEERPTSSYVSDFCIPPEVAIEVKRRGPSAHLDTL